MKRVIVELVDDITGDPIRDGRGRTVSLGFDGSTFEIDLSDENIEHLKNLLAPYLNVARPMKAGKRTQTTRDPQLQAIREWANSHGIKVSDRGRIAATVRKAYEASR